MVTEEKISEAYLLRSGYYYWYCLKQTIIFLSHLVKKVADRYFKKYFQTNSCDLT